MKKIFDVLNVIKQKLFVKKDKIHSEKYYRRIQYLLWNSPLQDTGRDCKAVESGCDHPNSSLSQKKKNARF